MRVPPVGRAVVRVPVVHETQVVPELMRENPAAAPLYGDPESATDVGYAADVDALPSAEDQVHEVGPDQVAQGVHLIQVTVGRIAETREVDADVAALDVRHLGHFHQRHSVPDPARGVGLIGLAIMRSISAPIAAAPPAESRAARVWTTATSIVTSASDRTAAR